jgi:tRNA-Thr(GGU) m(6)t(6)A37 methyltransferase TsaA
MRRPEKVPGRRFAGILQKESQAAMKPNPGTRARQDGKIPKIAGGRSILYGSIGVIHSDHTVMKKTPIQPVYAGGCRGRAVVFPVYADGLRDLEGFSHIYLVYHMHRAGVAGLTVKPYLQDVERGVFATRAPGRPNPIGLSIVRLVRREENVLHLDDVDILDGTPLLDIKPYTTRFDRMENVRNGWQDEVDSATAWERGRREDGGTS